MKSIIYLLIILTFLPGCFQNHTIDSETKLFLSLLTPADRLAMRSILREYLISQEYIKSLSNEEKMNLYLELRKKD